MSLRRLLFVLVALIVSGVTVIAGRAWLQAERPPQVATAAPAPMPAKPLPMVLVAKGNLPAGQFVRPENLRWMPWPEDGVSATYVVEGKHRIEDYVGAVVRSGLADGEPITEARVVRPGDRGFMAAVLTPGMRAVTVPVTVSSGNAGFVFPGDRVDLILTFSVKPLPVQGNNAPQGEEHRASETLLTDVRVLAVDQRADDQAKDPIVAKTATLEVTPKQAEIIAVATSFGQLSFSLRSLASGDLADNAKPLTHTWDNEAARLLAPPITASSTQKVSVVRAGDVKEVEFPRSIR
jgi:pilus assembly protein CpaB